MRSIFLIFALAALAYSAPTSSSEEETATVVSKTAEKKPDVGEKVPQLEVVEVKKEESFIEKAVDYVVDGFNSIVSKIKSAIGVEEEKKVEAVKEEKAEIKKTTESTEKAEVEKKIEAKDAKKEQKKTNEVKEPKQEKHEKKVDDSKSSEEDEKKEAAPVAKKVDNKKKEEDK